MRMKYFKVWKKYLLTKPAIFIYYFLFASLWTRPVIFHLRSMIIGYHDAWQFMWNFWWVKTAFFSGTSPFYTDYMHWPNGISLLFHTLNLPNAVASIPLQPILGLAATYNIILLLNFALTGLGVYLLAQYLTKNRFAAFVAGYIVTFSTFLIAHSYGHLNLMSFGWVALFILFYLKMLKSEANWKLPVLFLIIIALTDSYYFFYVVLFLIFHFLFCVLFNRQIFRQTDLIKNYWLTILFSFLLLGPYFGWMIYEKTTNGDFDFLGHDPLQYSVDLWAFFIPNFTSIFKNFTMAYWAKWHYSWENVGYLGYSVLILIGYGLGKMRKKNVYFWFFIFLIFCVLALGPYLQINGTVNKNIVLPYFWIQQYIPYISLQGVPARFVSFSFLAVAILVAFVFSDILKQKTIWKILIVAIFTLAIFIEYLPAQIGTSQIPLADFYTQLAQDKNDYAVIDMSFNYDRVLYYQTIHHKHLIGGYTSRTTKKTQDFLKNTPVINNIYHTQDFEENFDFKGGIEILKHYKIKYILVNNQDKKRLGIVGKLNLAIVFQNNRLTVFRVY